MWIYNAFHLISSVIQTETAEKKNVKSLNTHHWIQIGKDKNELKASSKYWWITWRKKKEIPENMKQVMEVIKQQLYTVV